MTLETQHETAEGGDGVDDEVGCRGLSYEDTSGGVVGSVAHVDEDSVKPRYVAEERHLAAPRSCPRVVLVVGKTGRSDVETQAVFAFGNGGFSWDFGSPFRARAGF